VHFPPLSKGRRGGVLKNGNKSDSIQLNINVLFSTFKTSPCPSFERRGRILKKSLN